MRSPAAPARPATLAIAAGAIVGTGARALVALALPVEAGGWPWATLAVNLLGSFALGAAGGWAATGRAPAWVRSPGFTTGLLGAFTTFSAVAVELDALVPAAAIGYGATSLAGGLLAAALGWRSGRGRP